MKKLVLAAALIAATFGGVTTANAWKAFAMNGTYVTFSGAGFSSEEDAREQAIYRCEEGSGSSCYETASVPESWSLAAVMCYGDFSVKGSKFGISAAIQQAAEDIGYDPSDCTVQRVIGPYENRWSRW